MKANIRAMCYIFAGSVFLLVSRAVAQDLFVTDIAKGGITEITPSGSQNTFSGLFAWGLASDGAGDLFATSDNNVYEFINNNGTLNPNPILVASGLDNPEEIVVNNAGDIFVAQTTSENNIVEITPGGVQSIFASRLEDPSGMAFNRAGDLFEADQGSGNIYEFTPAGAQSTVASGIWGTTDLAFDSAGNLYSVQLGPNTVIKITPRGVQTTVTSGLDNPQALAINNAGDLFVSDGDNGNVTEITPDGVQSIYGSGFWSPLGLAFAAPEPSAFGLLAMGTTAFLVRRCGKR